MPTSFDYHSVLEMPLGFWRWPHFSPAAEWACKETGRIVVVPDFMDRLEALRSACGFALPISSGYRSPEHDEKVGTSATPGAGPHTLGMACDIAITNPQIGILIRHALDLGFTGFGLSQKEGASAKFVHIDTVHASDTWWSYL